jgi:uncharacterized protein YecE (DUF72 family)
VTLWIGTSGWQYRHWRGRFYEHGLPTERWFDRYAVVFRTVALNVTFYRQPRPTVFEGWARRAPEGFLFAVKANRFITHVRRLREVGDSVDRLMDGALRLGPHLGPILLQLPPDMEAEPEQLAGTLAAFPRDVRLAVEPRNRSWFEGGPGDEVHAALTSAGAALCWADRRGPVTPVTPDWRTADWGYLRFHGGRARPPSCYGEDALATWVQRVRAAFPPTADAFAYFNNDAHACALRDAGVFARLAADAGLRPTLTPRSTSIAVG